MKKEKGSITIFSLISMLLITAAIFALLEGTRLQELHRFAQLQSLTALESGFANYNRALWQKYHLLGADYAQMKETVGKTAKGRMGLGANLLRLENEEIEWDSYTLLTDGDGAVFVNSVSSYMRANILYESVKEIYNQYEALQSLMGTSQMDLSNIEEALKEIENADLSKEVNSMGSTGAQNSESNTDVTELLETAKRWQEMGVLELVLEDTSKVSEAEHDFSNGLLVRELSSGKNAIIAATDWSDRVFLQQYLLSYMSCFTNAQSDRALSYELEYLLGEKDSDIENLKVTIHKLLAIREAANFLYLVSDSGKMMQVEGLATLLAGETLNPLLIEVVKIGLLTAWAFAESILDVRALLAGKRIALIKSEESWTVELKQIGMISEEFLMAKESNLGLTYENYLGILLLFEKEQKLAMRVMSIQEATIQKTYQDSSFRMDTLVTQAKAKLTYSYVPVFPFLRIVDAQERWEYKVSGTAEYGYY